MLAKTVLVLPNHQHTLKMGTELGPETSENHILTRLSPQENIMETSTDWASGEGGGKTRHEYKGRNERKFPLLCLDTGQSSLATGGKTSCI